MGGKAVIGAEPSLRAAAPQRQNSVPGGSPSKLGQGEWPFDTDKPTDANDRPRAALDQLDQPFDLWARAAKLTSLLATEDFAIHGRFTKNPRIVLWAVTTGPQRPSRAPSTREVGFLASKSTLLPVTTTRLLVGPFQQLAL